MAGMLEFQTELFGSYGAYCAGEIEDAGAIAVRVLAGEESVPIATGPELEQLGEGGFAGGDYLPQTALKSPPVGETIEVGSPAPACCPLPLALALALALNPGSWTLPLPAAPGAGPGPPPACCRLS
jgi:hypothetical protein